MVFKRRRNSIRLPNYDYSSPGSYYFTSCSAHRLCLFGEVRNRCMIRNDYGNIIQSTWENLPDHYGYVLLDEFIVMPNHIHGILHLRQPFPEELSDGSVHRSDLHTILGFLKSVSAKRINTSRNVKGISVWQAKSRDHIIRNEFDLIQIRDYIRSNPMNREKDEHNPAGSIRSSRRMKTR